MMTTIPLPICKLIHLWYSERVVLMIICLQAHMLPGGEGLILDMVKLPEAMKLQTENTFDGEFFPMMSTV
jgi:hypothetical protein